MGEGPHDVKFAGQGVAFDGHPMQALPYVLAARQEEIMPVMSGGAQ